MPNTVIQLKKSATVSAKPTDLANGELAINFADGKLFYKNTAGYIAEISGIQTNSFGTVNANNTLVVSDTTGDVITLLPGNNITIVGDAVNDRVTIGLSNDVTVPGVLYMQAVGGDEGGQIELANAITNSTLSGNVVIDIYQNRLRFYEKGSPNKGAFIDLSIAGSGVSSNLLATSSGTTDTVARSTAESAFLKANQVGEAVTTANTNTKNAYDTANLAFNKANSSGSVSVSDAAPGSPTANSLWWSSNVGKLFIYYNDGSSSQWVETSPAVDISTINSAFGTANSAFLKANQVGEAVTTANGNITAAFLKANQVGEAVTTANNNITAAFLKANQVGEAVTTANGNITAAFNKANAALANTTTTLNGNLTIVGTLTSTGVIRDNRGDVRDLPIINQTAGYGLSLADAGEVISTSSTIYVPSNIFFAGNAVSVFNNSAASITVTQNASVTMYLAGTATTGNRTLAQRGIATVLCVAANTFVISGAGLT